MKTSLYEIQSLADQMRRELQTYKPETLAKHLGISKRAVLHAIKSGNLKAKRVNARIFIIESPEAAQWWVSLSE